MPKKFERSETTEKLVNYLRPHDKGARIPYKELSDLVGQPITAHEPHLVYARRILQRDHNAIWTCITPKIGIRRLNDVEIAERLPTWWMQGARKKLSRGGDQAEVVEMDKLDIEQQTKFSVNCIQRELAFESLSKATRTRMEKTARGTSNDLPSFTAVEWMISLTPRKRPSP